MQHRFSDPPDKSSLAFLYLRDPLFHASVLVYAANRFLESVGISHWLTSFYLNDFVCLAFWLPVLVAITQWIGFRKTNDPPTSSECVIAFLIWATMFEVILPHTKRFSSVTVADPCDVLAYAIGGIAAQMWWRWWYAEQTIEEPTEGNKAV